MTQKVTQRRQGPDRREVLRFLAVLSVGSTSSISSLVGRPGQETVQKRSLEAVDFGDVEASALRDLAKAYEAYDAEDTAGIDAMAERLGGSGLGDDEVVASLRQEMKDDFAAGRTANLYGWMISRTEARVLAAAARLLA